MLRASKEKYKCVFIHGHLKLKIVPTFSNSISNITPLWVWKVKLDAKVKERILLGHRGVSSVLFGIPFRLPVLFYNRSSSQFIIPSFPNDYTANISVVIITIIHRVHIPIVIWLQSVLWMVVILITVHGLQFPLFEDLNFSDFSDCRFYYHRL